MTDKAGSSEDDYFIINDKNIQYLPEEMRQPLQRFLDEGSAALVSVQKELSQLDRIAETFSTLVTLKHVVLRLSQYKFSPDLEAILDNEILTTAFVVAYARLHIGGEGAGFSRDILPENLRKTHDDILLLRNKRIAHIDEHHSVETQPQIELHARTFKVHHQIRLGFHVGGANEWRELVDFIDNLTVERMQKILSRMKNKTGYEWEMAKGPSPE